MSHISPGPSGRCGPPPPAPVRGRRGRSLVGLILALAMSVVVSCAPSPHRDDVGPTVHLAFEKYALGNGLEVILRDDGRVPIAAVNLGTTWGRPTRPAAEPGSRTSSST